MTHEELLAKVEASDDNLNFYALRAVVELHKPWTATENDRYWGGFRNELGEKRCPACTMPSAYPCPTIQAIEKELK